MKLSLPFPARRLTLLRVMALAYLLTAWALWVWLPPEPDKVLELQRHGSQVAFSPDGSSLAVLLPAPDYYSDATIAIINRSDGSLLREFNIGHSSVWDMNWITPDGTLLSAQIHKSGNDVEATTRYYIWNAATGAEVASVLLNDPASADRSSSAVATRDGKYLAYTSWIARSSTLTLKDVPSNKARAMDGIASRAVIAMSGTSS